MVVSVVLSGLPQYIKLEDLGNNLLRVFAADYINTFHVRDLPNHPTTGKRRVALDFKSGFDGAMEAQNLLDGYRYTLDNGKTYTLKAKVNHDPALQRVIEFNDESFEACLVQYRNMAHDRILDMHLDSLQKQRDVIKSERKLLKEKKKLKEELKKFDCEGSSSDSEKKYLKKYKKRDKKRKKKSKKRDRSDLSSSEGRASDRSDAQSRSSTPVRRKVKTLTIEDVRPKADSSRRGSGASGSDLVPYPPRRCPSPLSSPGARRLPAPPPPPPPPTSRRNPSPGKRGSLSLESRRSSDSPPLKRRASSRRSGRRSPSASPPPPKRQRLPAAYAEPYRDKSESRYRCRSPSPTPSKSYRRSTPPPLRLRYSESRYEKDFGYTHRRDMASTSRSGQASFYGEYSVREVDDSYELGGGDGDELTKDIDDLLESVKNDVSDVSDESLTTSRIVNINLQMNVVKNSKTAEKEQANKEKKQKKMPLPIKMEPDGDAPRTMSKEKGQLNIRDLMPKPILVDQKVANIKKELEESTEDVEEGEIYEINDDDDDEEESHYTPTEYKPNAQWTCLTPEETPLPKIVPLNPRFVLPIAKIINSMKKHFSDLDKVKKYRLNAVLKDLLLARLKVMLKNEAGYKCTKEILVMYREHHPLEGDEGWVRRTLRDIDEGMYDVWIHDDEGVVVKQDDFLSTQDINSVMNSLQASTVVKKDIDTSYEFDFLQDSMCIEKMSNASDSTVVLDLQSPSEAIANLKMEMETPAEGPDVGLPVSVKREREHSNAYNEIAANTKEADQINITTITDETIHQEIVPADKSSAPSVESHTGEPTDNATGDAGIGKVTNIKTEFEETLDDIARFVEEVEVVKKVIDLTDE